MYYFIKGITLLLILSLGLSFNSLEKEDISIHSHNHLHIQGSSHIHEHIHIDSSTKLFYLEEIFRPLEISLRTTYCDIKDVNLNPIKQTIFKPPIV